MPHANVPDDLRDRPFTTAQARAAGVSATALSGPSWRRVLRGVWAHVDLPDTRETRLAAVRLVLPPRAVLRTLTAAWLYGADVRHRDDLAVHAFLPRDGRIRSRDGLDVSETTVAATDVVQLDGIALTSPTKTAADCLRQLRETESIVVTDALTHLGLTTVDEIRGYLAALHRVRNCRLAERRLALVEPATESPMETRLRLLLMRAGLPRPTPQWVLRTPGGAFVARLDFAWPDARVAIEYDGADHWQQRRHDDRRRAQARTLGWHVDVVSADDYWGAPAEVVAMVRSALAARGIAC